MEANAPLEEQQEFVNDDALQQLQPDVEHALLEQAIDDEDADLEDDNSVDELDCNEEEEKMDQNDPSNRGVKEHGCEHYRRRAMIVAPCCDKPFWCRHCHNAACNDNEVDPKKRHVLDRKARTLHYTRPARGPLPLWSVVLHFSHEFQSRFMLAVCSLFGRRGRNP